MSALASTSGSAANGRSSALPQDARLMALMLASKGVEDADERVLLQMLDFAHRYTTDLLLDAQTYSEHAGRPGRVETRDIELAVQSRSGWEWRESSGGPKDYLLPIAKQLNQIPLPPLRESYSHILLPPQHQQLGTINFNLVPRRAGMALSEEETGESSSESEGETGDGDEQGDNEEDAEKTTKITGAEENAAAGDEAERRDESMEVAGENKVDEGGSTHPNGTSSSKSPSRQDEGAENAEDMT